MEIDNVTSDQEISNAPAVNRKPYKSPTLSRLGEIQEVVQATSSFGGDACCSVS